MHTLRAVCLLLIALGITGCAGAGFNNAMFQTEVASGDLDKALEELERFSDDDVSALLDRGLLLQAKGDYAASNDAFALAEERIDDLYTRSLSKEALSLLTSDQALDYRASGFEHAYVAYYRAWNYLLRDEPEGVLVEARRINERLDFRSASCEDASGACGHDTFLRYFSGLLFQWGGEINSAYVAMKQADEAAATAREAFGLEPPPDLGFRLVTLARRLGFDDQAEQYREAYRLSEEDIDSAPPSSLVVLWENGLIGRREERTVILPIFKGETEKYGGNKDRWAHDVAERHEREYDRKKVDYLLRVSLPAYVDVPPRCTAGEFTVDGTSAPTRVVAPLSGMAHRSFEEAYFGILVRATVRGLTKYLASQTAEKEIGEGAGFVVNLLGVATENADVRSWRSLPHEIQTATFEVTEGKYDGELILRGGGGRVIGKEAFTGIVVPRNGIAFVRHRTRS